ncbi:hypothetical protein A9Y76_07245 [Ralstonia insidiosa]|uniref:Uncharacterized protein n=1 Tax=Ralstonia insidiosa TaxID=190721 RepID=A0A191ZVZ4_9RALS|nr:hypothetical protein [Ralstonia insidiosa]ANJ72274.1 hypothetical protein A9Y76_07245 [Ralstonia insidiosa]
MKNGEYKEITEIGLGKHINDVYFRHMNEIAVIIKKDKIFPQPIAILIKGDSNFMVPINDMTQEEYATALKKTCRFLGSEAIMIFSEASCWTGTEEEHQFVIEQMGSIHGHAKAVEILTVFIETQGKSIIGIAEIETKGNKRVIKAMDWVVRDVEEEDEDEILFSHFLNKEKETV